MNLKLTIEASPSVLAQILASLPQGAAISTPGMNSPMSAPGGDDDEGDGPPSTAAFDSKGMPWDARIHSDKRGTKEDGSWRYRRGVDKNLIPVVEAELKGGQGQAAAPQPPQPIQPSPMMPIPPQVPMQPPAMPVTQPIVPQVPPPYIPPQMPVSDVAPPTAPVAQGDPSLDFAGFMQHISGQMGKRDGAGQPLLSPELLAQYAAMAAQQFNDPSIVAITDVATKPEALKFLIDTLTTHGRW